MSSISSSSSDSSRLNLPVEAPSSVLLEPEFPFNDELGSLWLNALSFSGTISSSRRHIEPLHLALVLLYENLKSSDDTRLIHATTATALERPLFWVAISQAAKFTLPDSLVHHIQATTYKDETELTLQASIGQAMWEKIQSLHDPILPVIEVTNVS